MRTDSDGNGLLIESSVSAFCALLRAQRTAPPDPEWVRNMGDCLPVHNSVGYLPVRSEAEVSMGSHPHSWVFLRHHGGTMVTS